MRVLPTPLLAFGLLLLLAGCGMAPSVHPLSDEKTTVLDERLLGRWYGLNDDGEAAAKRPDLLYVGRRTPDGNELEAAWIELADEQVHVRKLRVRTTKIGTRHYLCATGLSEMGDALGGVLGGVEGVPQPVWLLLHYEILGPNLLRVAVLDPTVVGNAIRAGALAGKAELEEGTEADPEYENVLIEASTDELRTWVAANAEKAFPLTDAVRLRRAEAPNEEDDPEDDE